MNNSIKSMLLAILAFCVLAMLAAKPAAATTYAHRNIFGYINTPLGEAGEIASVWIYDDTAGGNLNCTGTLTNVDATTYFKWTCGYLLTSHEYHLIVTGYNGDRHRVDFYLPNGWSNAQQIATVTVNSN